MGRDDGWSGPIDEATHPEVLDAHVVTPGASPRLRGYDVEGDLARHYGLVEIMLLALTGELPQSWQARSAEIALGFFAPASVAEAPTHAAVVTRICGGQASAVVGVAAVTLAEQAQSIVDRHRPWIEWLGEGRTGAPKELLATSDTERSSVQQLRYALEREGIACPDLDEDLSRDAALLAVLFRAGVRRPEQLITMLVTVRLPVALAEASSWKHRAFREYPMDLPRFRYRETP